MSTPIQHGSPQKRIAGMAANVSANPSPRRVLGDVTNSARNSPRNPHAVANETGKAIPIGSPLKQSQTMTPAAILSTKENRGQLAFASPKKRPFEDMDDAEDHADADKRSARRIVTMSPSRHLTNIARPPTITIMPLPDDNSSTDEDEPIHQDLSDADAVAEPIGSFSSLIDYDPANASDKSSRASLEPIDEDEQIPSRAELLKLRLKMAMYKVKTNQCHLPFSNLALPHFEPVQLENSSDDEDDIILEVSHSQGPKRGGHSTKAAPANITITGGPVSKLLPPPVLLPTAFSSRFITAPVSSSPPRTISVTPLPPRTAFDLDGVETPESGHIKRIADNGRDLTSSVVKGRAASGLLELMKAR